MEDKLLDIDEGNARFLFGQDHIDIWVLVRKKSRCNKNQQNKLKSS